MYIRKYVRKVHTRPVEASKAGVNWGKPLHFNILQFGIPEYMKKYLFMDKKLCPSSSTYTVVIYVYAVSYTHLTLPTIYSV